MAEDPFESSRRRLGSENHASAGLDWPGQGLRGWFDGWMEGAGFDRKASMLASIGSLLADAGKTVVPQVSKPAVSPISKSAGRRKGVASAGLETRDTADLEVCGTGFARASATGLAGRPAKISLYWPHDFAWISGQPSAPVAIRRRRCRRRRRRRFKSSQWRRRMSRCMRNGSARWTAM